MKVIANRYFSPQLKQGDSYELPDREAHRLIALGLMRRAEDPPAAVQPPAAEPPAPAAPSRSRSYRRRDLQAADV